jgi:hypothetical protein
MAYHNPSGGSIDGVPTLTDKTLTYLVALPLALAHGWPSFVPTACGTYFNVISMYVYTHTSMHTLVYNAEIAYFVLVFGTSATNHTYTI